MNESRPTIWDVAKLAGVSISTVSRVLNNTAPVSEELAKRVTRVVREYNYHPSHAARSLSGTKTGTIGVLMNLDPEYHFRDFVSMETLRGITSAAGEQGLQVNIVVGGIDEVCERYVSQRLVDGLIVMGLRQREEYLLEQQRPRLPIVLTNYDEAYRGYPTVSFAHQDNAYRLTSLVISKGHTDIGFVDFSRNLLYLKNRKQGFLRALHESGLERRDDYLLEVKGLDEQEAGREGALIYLERPKKPTVLMAPSDNVALACMTTLTANGVRIPEDVSITGVDDVPLARFAHPPLATEAIDGYLRGRKSMEMMVELLGGQELSRRHMFIHSEIRQRESLAEVSGYSTRTPAIAASQDQQHEE